MHFALFGATGGTGREVVRQGLAAGHTIRALVRDPAKLPAGHPHLAAVPGNVLDPEPVSTTLLTTEAAIVCLGNTGVNPDRVVSAGTQLVIEAMQRQGIRRLIVVTSLGVGDSRPQVSFVFRMLAQTVLRKAMQDKEAQEEMVRASDLDWTIVRPGGLTHEPATGRYTVSTSPSLHAGRLSRADLAAFLLAQLHDTAYLRQTCAIT